MAPVIVLFTVTVIGRAVGLLGVDYLDTWPEALAVGLAAMFLLTCSPHFISERRAGLISIVPTWVPNPHFVVSATGALEALGAVGLLIPGPLRTAAAIALAVLLVAMFPANVYAAGERRGPHAPNTPLPRRTVLQVIYLAAAVIVAAAG